MSDKVADLLDRGFNHELGFSIRQWHENHAELELLVSDKLLNRSDILHGGVVSTLLDVGGGLAGCYCAVEGNVRRAVTLSLSVQFMDSVSRGVVIVTAKRQPAGYRVFFADAELSDDKGNLLATAHGTYQYTKGSESIEGVPLLAG